MRLPAINVDEHDGWMVLTTGKGRRTEFGQNGPTHGPVKQALSLSQTTRK